jgi:hypothetical protein
MHPFTSPELQDAVKKVNIYIFQTESSQDNLYISITIRVLPLQLHDPEPAPSTRKGQADSAPGVKMRQLHSSRIDAALQVLTERHNASTLWGTYQPNRYFGIKSRTHPVSVGSGKHMDKIFRRSNHFHLNGLICTVLQGCYGMARVRAWWAPAWSADRRTSLTSTCAPADATTLMHIDISFVLKSVLDVHS